MGSSCGKSIDWGGDVEKDDRRRWRVFSLKELQSATNNFNYDNKLEEGGVGSIFWGQLSDTSQIAVKRLKVYSDKAKVEFEEEVEILGRIRHKNILKFRGYCAEGQERLLVYDYMPNLNLFVNLHGPGSESLLDWRRRMNVAVGSAEGIAYLHHRAEPRITHKDIKSSNILLDSDFQPHISNLNSAKLIPDDSETHMINEDDIHSFGILLLELVTGRKPLEITDWALPLAREKKFEEMADPKLKGEFVMEEMRRVVTVAFACLKSDIKKRPTMVEVVEMLKGKSKDKLLRFEKDQVSV